jgi:hypothetical protein
MREYKILRVWSGGGWKDTFEVLEKMVNEHIEKGYTTVGGVTRCDFFLIQAMALP